jgi:hypothetical protein
VPRRHFKAEFKVVRRGTGWASALLRAAPHYFKLGFKMAARHGFQRFKCWRGADFSAGCLIVVKISRKFCKIILRFVF